MTSHSRFTADFWNSAWSLYHRSTCINTTHALGTQYHEDFARACFGERIREVVTLGGWGCHGGRCHFVDFTLRNMVDLLIQFYAYMISSGRKKYRSNGWSRILPWLSWLIPSADEKPSPSFYQVLDPRIKFWIFKGSRNTILVTLFENRWVSIGFLGGVQAAWVPYC